MAFFTIKDTDAYEEDILKVVYCMHRCVLVIKRGNQLKNIHRILEVMQ
jgi:hypothetical protein